MSPFDKEPMTSYRRSIVTMALSRVVFWLWLTFWHSPWTLQ